MKTQNEQAVAVVSSFLANPNTARFLAVPAVRPSIASAVASDFLRKMGVEQRAVASRWIAANHPELAAVIAANHPAHWG